MLYLLEVAYGREPFGVCDLVSTVLHQRTAKSGSRIMLRSSLNPKSKVPMLKQGLVLNSGPRMTRLACPLVGVPDLRPNGHEC